MIIRDFAPAVFWLGLILLLHTFLGYGLIITFLARLVPKRPAQSADFVLPDITIVIVAHNEDARIGARIGNLLDSDYPSEKLRILVVSDGSTDQTAAFVTALGNPRVSLLSSTERRGKAAGLNEGVAACASPIVVFTDSRQRFATDTIRRLVAHFADPSVGAVSGSLEIGPSRSSVGEGVDIYWRYEKILRAAESRLDSCIGCTGAVYAIRRSLFTALPEDTILDDVVIPMRIAQKGYRVLHDPAATAFDPQPLEPAAERIRKRRTLAGNFQMLFRHPAWLTPLGHRLWWQLISHKYLRVLAPWFLFTTLLANIPLLGAPFYRVTFYAQLALYSLAAFGICFPSLKGRLFSIPAGFVFLNARAVQALWHYLRGADLHRWSSPTPPVPPPVAG